jgi:hypothetical protein
MTDAAEISPVPDPAAAVRLSRHQRREVAACDALRTLLRDCYESQHGVRPPASGEIRLELAVKALPAGGWKVVFDPPVAEQVDAQLAEAQAQWAVYRRGAVFCFRCGSSACEHAVPPGPLEVFRGYGSTGIPEWCELVQSALDCGDSRAAELYADPPRILACLQMGRTLKERQLSSFGRASRTYSVLGQVVAGYFRMPARRRLGAEPRLALTIQIVETRGAKGETVVALNRIAGGVEPEDLDERLAGDWQPGLTRALEQGGRRVESLANRILAVRSAGPSADVRILFREVPAILRGIARDIEGGHRQDERRTHHVEERRRIQRPIHKALEEARAAGPGDLFFDEKRQTIIACGRQNRAHVFNEAGRHVTSFILPSDGADFRMRTGRWRRLDADEQVRFRQCISNLPQ